MERLLTALEKAISQNQDTLVHNNWQLTRIFGGMNGITYKAVDSQSPDTPLAVKLRKRTEQSLSQQQACLERIEAAQQ